MRQRIAVIGTGISGLVAAHRLHQDHDITVFESNDYIGGHTNTVDVELGGRIWPVDTGFIVFNERNYVNFIALLDELDVASHRTTMSFSVRCDAADVEYNGTSLNRLFVQRRNLVRPSFYRMIRDILRFYRESRELLTRHDDDTTLGDYLEACGYSAEFVDRHILPMGAAIWSADPVDMLSFPAACFVRFFEHHGFLDLTDRPHWRVVDGGSSAYVRKLIAPFRDRIRTSTPVTSVTRSADEVLIGSSGRPAESFDAVVIAAHSDQALRMLDDPTPAETDILGAIPYARNPVVLHTDTSLLPRRRKAWASWNYLLTGDGRSGATVTYNQNILQGLDAPETFCVTLNQTDLIDPSKVLRSFTYTHPQFDVASVRARGRRDEISGHRNTYYCGAYWGFGFHEDGVKSALHAVARLKENLAWKAASTKAG